MNAYRNATAPATEPERLARLDVLAERVEVLGALRHVEPAEVTRATAELALAWHDEMKLVRAKALVVLPEKRDVARAFIRDSVSHTAPCGYGMRDGAACCCGLSVAVGEAP